MDEGAGRSHGKPALRHAFAVREGRRQEHPERPAAIHLGLGTDAAAGSRRHHHAERAVLRTPPWRHSRHRSGAAPADAAWPGRQADDLHHGRPATVSLAVAHLLPGMLRQPRLQEALWQDGLRSRRAVELRRMDRGQPETAVAGSGLAEGSKMGGRRGRRLGGADAQHSDRKMPRRCDAGVQPERRAAAPAAGLSAAAVPAFHTAWQSAAPAR